MNHEDQEDFMLTQEVNSEAVARTKSLFERLKEKSPDKLKYMSSDRLGRIERKIREILDELGE